MFLVGYIYEDIDFMFLNFLSFLKGDIIIFVNMFGMFFLLLLGM